MGVGGLALLGHLVEGVHVGLLCGQYQASAQILSSRRKISIAREKNLHSYKTISGQKSGNEATVYLYVFVVFAMQ